MGSEDQHNENAWDDLVRRGSAFANPARPEDFRNPTPIINPFGWLPKSFSGLRVLCLAAGGGRHGPLFAAGGAMVTIIDISDEMLQLDQEVARREGVNVTTLQASMSDLNELGAQVFDIVLQPVSTCYVEDIVEVYREVARVIKPGGIYVSQHKQPISLQAATLPNAGGRYELIEAYYREGALPPVSGSEHREVGTHEFLHTLESILGGLCQVGFSIEDLREPRHGNPDAPLAAFAGRSCYVPPYLAVKAVRHASEESASPSLIWTPAAG